MKRLDLRYNAHPYTLADTDPDDLSDRILAVATSAEPAFWLQVNDGEGMYKPT